MMARKEETTQKVKSSKSTKKSNRPSASKDTKAKAQESKSTKKPRRSTSSNKSKKSANILPKDDPNFMREKSKYESPIASREYIINLIDKSSDNLNFDNIAKAIKANQTSNRSFNPQIKSYGA